MRKAGGFLLDYLFVLTPCLVFVSLLDYTIWASWWDHT